MMNTDRERLEYLLNRYTQKTCSFSEMQELLDHISNPESRNVLEQLTDEHLEQLKMEAQDSGVDWKFIYKKIIPGEKEKAKVVPMRKRVWFQVAAAAVFIGILVGAYWLVERKSTVESPQSTVVVTKDVEAPKSARAMITLANGEQIFLDSAGRGTLATQGNINIAKLADGEIVYSQESGARSQEIQYNTLTNPRGSKVVNLTLADGSKVWLNAESSLKYPTAFVGKERRVEITGEAYFEVSHNANKPFTATVNGMEVQVLGTQFNINAYSDEAVIKTTLLEGSVRIIKNTNSKVLTPGQQLQLNRSGDMKLVSGADREETMAWKNGFFSFHSADIPTVMRQLARWYDVEVEYTNGIPKREFEGAIDRSLSLAKVLSILEKMRVHFKIGEDKKILILP